MLYTSYKNEITLKTMSCIKAYYKVSPVKRNTKSEAIHPPTIRNYHYKIVLTLGHPALPELAESQLHSLQNYLTVNGQSITKTGKNGKIAAYKMNHMVFCMLVPIITLCSAESELIIGNKKCHCWLAFKTLVGQWCKYLNSEVFVFLHTLRHDGLAKYSWITIAQPLNPPVHEHILQMSKILQQTFKHLLTYFYMPYRKHVSSNIHSRTFSPQDRQFETHHSSRHIGSKNARMDLRHTIHEAAMPTNLFDTRKHPKAHIGSRIATTRHITPS